MARAKHEAFLKNPTRIIEQDSQTPQGILFIVSGAFITALILSFI